MLAKERGSEMFRFIFGLIGLVLPARFTGPKLLETELVQNGVPRGTIPIACLREFVDEEIGHAKADAKRWVAYGRSGAKSGTLVRSR
jgi:hypothetical protein